jgi:hypothetical protein
VTSRERATALVLITERTINELAARRVRLEREVAALVDDEATWAELGRRAVKLLARSLDERRREPSL